MEKEKTIRERLKELNLGPEQTKTVLVLLIVAHGLGAIDICNAIVPDVPKGIIPFIISESGAKMLDCSAPSQSFFDDCPLEKFGFDFKDEIPG